jgi:transposase
MLLTAEQWQLLLPHLPHAAASSGSPPSRGRPHADDRLVLEAILWKFATGTPWYDLPDRYPPYQTCYLRYRQWRRTGLFARLVAILAEDLRTRGGVDFTQAIASGDILLSRQDYRWQITCSERLRGTWQLATLYILLGLALHKLRRSTSPLIAPRPPGNDLLDPSS